MLQGLGSYFCVAALLTLLGLGVQRIARARLEPALAWLLAPCLGQALLACVLGGAVALRLPLKQLVVPLWGSFAIVAALGLPALLDWWRGVSHHSQGRDGQAIHAVVHSWPQRGLAVALALSWLLPFAAVWPYLIHGGLLNYRGSGLWDGWAYIAIGQYFWEYGRSSNTGLPLFYQYGAAFGETRFVASAQLTWLASYLRLPDTQAAMGLLQVGGLFATLASCAAFAFVRNLSWRLAAVYLMLVGISGWLANVVWANNCDHLLALAYFPALIAQIEAPAPLSGSRSVLLALSAAGLLYTYPEMAWLGLASSGLALIERRIRRRERDLPFALGVTVAVSLLLVAPYGVTMWRFMSGQFAHSMAPVQRPGEALFTGLVQPSWSLSAFWGLGGEHLLTLGRHVENVAALGLTGLTLVGVWLLVRARERALLGILLGLTCGVAIFAIGFRYGYATYKLVLTGWWLWAFVLLLGLRGLAVSAASRLGSRLTAALLVPAILCAAAIPVLTLVRQVRVMTVPNLLLITRLVPMQRFQAVREAGALLDGHGVALATKDVEATHWAFYYLRDRPLRLGTFGAYLNLPAARRSFARAHVVPWEEVRYVLSDADTQLPFVDRQGWTRVWSGGAYSLWDAGASDWVEVAAVRSTNGVDIWQGRPFIWLGDQPLQFQLLASRAGVVHLEAEFWPGPHVASGVGAARRLRLADATGCASDYVIDRQTRSLPIRVVAGHNDVTITALDRAVPSSNPVDRRILVLGIKGPQLSRIEDPEDGAVCPSASAGGPH